MSVKLGGTFDGDPMLAAQQNDVALVDRRPIALAALHIGSAIEHLERAMGATSAVAPLMDTTFELGSAAAKLDRNAEGEIIKDLATRVREVLTGSLDKNTTLGTVHRELSQMATQLQVAMQEKENTVQAVVPKGGQHIIVQESGLDEPFFPEIAVQPRFNTAKFGAKT